MQTPPTSTSTPFNRHSSASSASSTSSDSPESSADPSHPPLLPQVYPGGLPATQIRLTQETPLKRNSASVRSRGSETHRSLDPHLALELGGHIAYNVDRFLDLLLMPSDLSRRSHLDALIDACLAQLSAASRPHPLMDVDRTGWVSCRNYDERVFLPELSRLWDSLVSLAASSSPSTLSDPSTCPLLRRRLRPNMNRYCQGSTTRRKLDFYVVDQDSPAEDSLHWARMLILGEAKNRVQDPTPADLAVQIGGYAREVFYAQPHRRFVHALYAQKSEVTLFRFDRGGALCSPRFDMHHEWQTLVRTILAYAYMDPLDLGFDPSFEPVPPSPPSPGGSLLPDGPMVSTTSTLSPSVSNELHEPQPLHLTSLSRAEPPPANTYSLTIGADTYLLGNVLDSRKVVTGRATNCWEATLISGKERRPNYVIKDSWRQTGQRGEGTIYHLAKQAAVEGLLDMVAEVVAPDPCDPQRVETVLGSVRRGCTGQSLPERRKRKTAGPTGEEPLSKKKSGEKRRSAGKGRSVGEEVPKSSGERGSPVAVVDRVRVRVIFCDAVGIPLHLVPSARDFFRVIRDALQCHRDLYVKAGILHRDISTYNILQTTPSMKLTGDVTRHGVLFDLDYALPIKVFSSGAQHRTGTLPFLAVRLLKGNCNTYRADLESFFYVMCYACVVFTGGRIQTQKPSRKKKANDSDDDGTEMALEAERPLREWETGSLSDIGARKVYTLEDPVEYRKRVLDHFTPLFKTDGAVRLMKTLRAHVVSSPWFSMKTLSERIEEQEVEMKKEQAVWEEKRKTRGITAEEETGLTPKCPAHRLRVELMAEEDECAHKLYKNMTEAIDEALRSNDL